ncbi:polypeptide N-acetylgalactosaminyltransferase-like 6, partial [Empidonax traillii]|uniref:polypeptide N-acetylgalactosaminyltransferase-like 6 n=1 Tax=Empidonax traillii TaxID=164674 RepID=UPI000FFDA923
CKHKVYLETLPNTSIIIPFHNEGWTSLLRTIHSIINRTPDSLIAEIILVDDFSDREHLKEKLEEYMVRFAKVRIVRTKKREGLIRTRLLGASLARGEVLTFLDSHCEVNVNWLPPLLNQIALNHKTIVCPMIDVIDHNHFGYEAQAGDAMRGAFDWEMYYKRIPIPPELQRADPSDPFESPVMAGGLFAVNRKWFWELGGYDPGLEIWGGEQYEISFKVLSGQEHTEAGKKKSCCFKICLTFISTPKTPHISLLFSSYLLTSLQRTASSIAQGAILINSCVQIRAHTHTFSGWFHSHEPGAKM